MAAWGEEPILSPRESPFAGLGGAQISCRGKMPRLLSTGGSLRGERQGTRAWSVLRVFMIVLSILRARGTDDPGIQGKVRRGNRPPYAMRAALEHAERRAGMGGSFARCSGLLVTSVTCTDAFRGARVRDPSASHSRVAMPVSKRAANNAATRSGRVGEARLRGASRKRARSGEQEEGRGLRLSRMTARTGTLANQYVAET